MNNASKTHEIKSLRPGARLRVRAEHLDADGAGVAHAADTAVHIAGLLPGEGAEIEVLHRSVHGRTAWARVYRRHDASPERVIPRCPGYGQCGGCVLQHLDYPAQLLWKQERLAAALAGGGVALPADGAGACVPSSPWGYRGRVKLVAAPRPGGGVMLGAYAPRSHQVLDMVGCRLVAPGLDAVARRVAAVVSALGLVPYDEQSRHGALRYVLLRDSAEGAVQVSLIFAEVPGEAVLGALRAALAEGEGPAITSLLCHENRDPGDVLLPAGSGEDRALLGDPWLWDRIGDLSIRVSARSFLQVNREIAGRLYADLATALDPRPGEAILDLYCGVGGIGLGLLRRVPGASLVGIEENPWAVADAEAGAARLEASARFFTGDAGAHEAGAGPFALCVVNPPRRGCSETVLARLVAAAPRAVAYVSCDPDTLARDLVRLQAAGFTVERVTPYDMHPHTPHVEALALLRGPGSPAAS